MNEILNIVQENNNENENCQESNKVILYLVHILGIHNNRSTWNLVRSCLEQWNKYFNIESRHTQKCHDQVLNVTS